MVFLNHMLNNNYQIVAKVCQNFINNQIEIVLRRLDKNKSPHSHIPIHLSPFNKP